MERCTTCVLFLLRLHNNQLVSNNLLVPTLTKLRATVRGNLQARKVGDRACAWGAKHRPVTLQDEIGFNLAALRYCKRALDMGVGMSLDSAASMATGATGTSKRQKR